MKKLIIMLFCTIALFSCKNDPGNNQKEQVSQTTKNFSSPYTSVGDTFTPDSILSVNEMNEHYRGMEEGDTIRVKFKADVNSVCKNKGCWMKLDMKDGNETLVKFRDYAFFVPKDIQRGGRKWGSLYHRGICGRAAAPGGRRRQISRGGCSYC